MQVLSIFDCLVEPHLPFLLKVNIILANILAMLAWKSVLACFKPRLYTYFFLKAKHLRFIILNFEVIDQPHTMQNFQCFHVQLKLLNKELNSIFEY